MTNSQPTMDDDLSGLHDVFKLSLAWLGLPLAALGMINIVQYYFHIELISPAQNIVDGYREVTHLFVQFVYWIPIHFFKVSVPKWFHDVAVLSVISSAISWKAFAGKGHPLVDWQVNLNQMLIWAVYPPDDEDTDSWDWLMYLLTVIPLFFVHLFSWLVGHVAYNITRIKHLAGISAATTRVVLRGVFLLGVLIFFHHLYSFLRSGSDGRRNDERRRDAVKYFLYIGAVLFSAFLFFGTLGTQPLIKF